MTAKNLLKSLMRLNFSTLNPLITLNPTSKLEFTQKLILLALPPVLFFSAFPALTLNQFFPSITSLNLEISLPELWLIFFSLVSLSRLLDPAHFHSYFLDFRSCFPMKTFLISLIFPAYAFISLFWTKNLLRGFLTAALLTLLWFSVLNIIVILKASPGLRPLLKKTLLLFAIIVSIFCWCQCFANVFLNQNLLLCLGCTYSAFGFPHPNGFTLEPQFMGNLLLAPALLSLKNLATRRGRLVSIFLISTLFLTFSRGAIYAFLLALPIVLLTTKKSLLKIPSIILASFLISLLTQGFFAQFSPVNTTFYDGIRASISQLSLNIINLPTLDNPQVDSSSATLDSSTEIPDSQPVQSPTPASEFTSLTDSPNHSISTDSLSSETPEPSLSSPTFTGYVPESTNIRLRLSELALDRWDDDPLSLIFGTGAGSAGSALYEKFPTELGTNKEIVQNEYVSLLLEFGVIPYCIIILIIVKFHKTLYKTFRKDFRRSIRIPLLLAYIFSLLFFSGLPNALHIYLLPFLF